MLSFSAKNITKDLLVQLPERSRRVLTDRFGLSTKGDRRTLDAIGKEYGITRERVRQIENHGIMAVRESEAYEVHGEHLESLKKVVEDLGSVIAENVLLEALSKNESERRHLNFLLTVGHFFDSRREDENFKMRWHTDAQFADQVESALASLYEATELEKLTPQEDFIIVFSKHLRDAGIKNKSQEMVERWLSMSNLLGKNPLGEWGRLESPHVRIKNTRDFAYLTLKRHGSPMHFAEVARGIESLFKRKTHPATTHNELIKDGRFVLVGRGLYALNEWGYAPGVVREVIQNILTREGPLSREEIIERVKRERYVKDATIAVNLQSGIFTKLADGRFALAGK